MMLSPPRAAIEDVNEPDERCARGDRAEDDVVTDHDRPSFAILNASAQSSNHMAAPPIATGSEYGWPLRNWPNIAATANPFARSGAFSVTIARWRRFQS